MSVTPEGRERPLATSVVPSSPSPTAGSIIVLAFDFGTRRIGVAVGNTLTGSARALTVLEAPGAADRLADAATLVGHWQAGRVIVGIPVHADGTPHAMTRRATAFARDLASRVAVPVEHADERHTTALAQDRLDADRAGRGARAMRDAIAAQLILQGWLDAHR